MTAPLYERLHSYISKNRISFAMPGHKNGRGLRKDLLSLDVTELDATENLHHPNKYIKKAQALLAELYKSEQSYILTGGSTAAIQAMICGALTPSSTLLASSDCHMSVINTCALLGISIKFFPKEIDAAFGIPTFTESIDQYLTDDVNAVIITSPNYYGVCSDIKTIAMQCHKKGIALLVDEAHGAHFCASDRFPNTSVKYADAVCHSAHKTLNAMNGAAYLHVNGKLIDRVRLEKSLSMFQSSSPSYVIAASADIARDELSSSSKWDLTYDMCADFKDKVKQLGINTLENDDMTRIVLNFSGFGITGFSVSEYLSQNGIDIEMADLFNIVLIVTPSVRKDDMHKLFTALEKFLYARKSVHTIPIIPPPPVCTETLSPQKAFFSPHTQIKFEESAGRLSCSTIVPYPPGIPVIYTGEIIKKNQIEYIKQISALGAEITGLTDGNIAVSE